MKLSLTTGAWQYKHVPEDFLLQARTDGFTILTIPPLHKTDEVDKVVLLAHVAKALRFPKWFGGNWDSLLDCLTDLSWWPKTLGYIILWPHLSWTTEDENTLAAVLTAVAERWEDQKTPFWTFAPLPQLPKLP